MLNTKGTLQILTINSRRGCLFDVIHKLCKFEFPKQSLGLYFLLGTTVTF